MSMLPAVVHAFEGQVHEEQVGQGVDEFYTVGRCIIILSTALAMYTVS